jgi:hypothetical protein
MTGLREQLREAMLAHETTIHPGAPRSVSDFHAHIEVDAAVEIAAELLAEAVNRTRKVGDMTRPDAPFNAVAYHLNPTADLWPEYIDAWAEKIRATLDRRPDWDADGFNFKAWHTALVDPQALAAGLAERLGRDVTATVEAEGAVTLHVHPPVRFGWACGRCGHLTEPATPPDEPGVTYGRCPNEHCDADIVWTYMRSDRGELDLGIIREPTGDARNDVAVFHETFDGIIDPRQEADDD